ncbi:MAG: GerMN domain-containing protein [Niameybacter sp.]|nr:GerMN domain-containing protein [Niameybacter sp.]
MNKWIRIPLLLLSLSFLLLGVGCFNGNSSGGDLEKVNLYFYDEHQNALVMEERKLEITADMSNESLMLTVIDALAKGPQASNQGARPINFNIDQAILKERSAFINFTKDYDKLDTPTQIIHRAMLVYTLTELEFIDKIEFFAGDQPLVNSNGEKIEPVERKDILISVLNPKPPTNSQIITLYFPGPQGDLLYKEPREIRVDNNTPLENYILAELIKGPVTQGLVAPLPIDTKVNAIKTQDGVCQIDLSYDLQVPQLANGLREDIVIYSIVDSLTELSRIKKVIFLKDGKKQTEFTLPIHTGGIFERNEAIIAPTP